MSISKCLKTVSTIDPADVAEIKALTKQYRDQGIDRKTASINAVESVMETLIDERNAIVEQIIEAGGIAEEMDLDEFIGKTKEEEAKKPKIIETDADVAQSIKKEKPVAKVEELPDQIIKEKKVDSDKRPKKTDKVKDKPSSISEQVSGEPVRQVGLPASKVKEFANKLIKGWKTKPKITVVESAIELPEKYFEAYFKGKSAKAFIDDKTGEVFIVADEIKNEEQIERAVFHEILGHAGLRGLFGNDINPLMRQVWAAFQGTKEMQAVVGRYKGKLNPKNAADQLKLAEELMANMAEKVNKGTLPQRLQNLWDQIIAFVKDALRAMGFRPKLSKADLTQIVMDAANHIRKGTNATSVPLAVYRKDVMATLFRQLKTMGIDADLLKAIRKQAKDAKEFLEVVYQRELKPARETLKEQAAALQRQADEANENSRSAIEIKLANKEGEAKNLNASISELYKVQARSNRLMKEGQPTFMLDDEKGEVRQYTEEQQAAIDRGGFGKRANKTIKEKFDSVRDRIGNKLRQGIVDQFDSFKSILKDNRAWMMAHLTSAANGALEATIQYGRPYLKDGAITVNTDKKSLQEIFLPLGHELNDWLAWVAGNRAESLKAVDKERLFSDVNIEALKSLNQGTTASGKDRARVYEDVRKEFEAMSNAITGIGVETGLIGVEERELWKEQGFYLPFYRMLDEGEARGPRALGVGGLAKQTAYKKLKGADLQLNDLLSNVILNWHHLLGASLKNQSAAHALATAENIGLAKQIDAADKSKNAIFVRHNGKQVWYEVSDGQDGALVLDSLLSLNWVGLNTTSMKIMRTFKRALTIGVVASPSFKIRNLLRDSIQAIAVADMSTQVHKNLYEGWKGTKQKSRTKAAMIAGGGAFGDSGYIHGADPDAIRYLVDKGVERETILDSRNHLHKLWDSYQDFGARLENVNRAANFEQALAAGRDLLSANFEARDHLDFARTGSFTAVRAIAQVVPFLNARLQGLDKLGRAAMDMNQRAQFTAVVGIYSIASVILYLAMKDDDDFKATEDWERDSYHMFKVPGSEIMYRMPRPFEVGAIASVFERLVEQMVDDDVHGELFAERLWFTLGHTLAFNPIPQAFKPALEVYANKNSFTGRSIESVGMQSLSPVERKRAWTSETAIWFSGQMDNISWGKVVLSPVQVEHLVRGYLGWAGATVLGSVDMLVTRPLSDAPSLPAKKITDLPIIRSFAKSSPTKNSKYNTLFYENLREINEAYSNIRNARKLGEMKRAKEMSKAEKNKLRWLKQYNKAQKYLSILNAEITRIRLSKTISADRKEQLIDKLIIRKNKTTKRIIEYSKKDLR